jgi:membrane protein YdbS with pleckstrin-like domain
MVSSIKTTYNSYPMLLVIAAIIGIGGFILSNQNNSSYGVSFTVVLAIILVSIHFVTRKHVCVITSSEGSRIVFVTSNMSHNGLLSFIDRVEEANTTLP